MKNENNFLGKPQTILIIKKILENKKKSKC
jgi:hypothetical protein